MRLDTRRAGPLYHQFVCDGLTGNGLRESPQFSSVQPANSNVNKGGLEDEVNIRAECVPTFIIWRLGTLSFAIRCPGVSAGKHSLFGLVTRAGSALMHKRVQFPFRGFAAINILLVPPLPGSNCPIGSFHFLSWILDLCSFGLGAGVHEPWGARVRGVHARQ